MLQVIYHFFKANFNYLIKNYNGLSLIKLCLVSVGFNELKKKTAPVTSVIGLLNFDLANLQERTKGTGDALIYISDSLMDLYYDNKVLGMEISTTKEGEVAIHGQAIDVTGLGGEAVKSALETAGFPLPDTPVGIMDQIRDTWDPDIDVMRARLDALTATLPEEVSKDPPAMTVGRIFGTYNCVVTYEDGNTETSTCTIEDNGDGTVAWISDDMDVTTLSFNESTKELSYHGEGLDLEIQFSAGVGGVTGTGRIINHCRIIKNTFVNDLDLY